MKLPGLLFIIFLLISLNAKTQDGSDIRYFNIGNIDTSFVGDTVHLDFYKRSFATIKPDNVTIIVNNKPVLFIEHREDNGYNNWFHRQYLESLEKLGTDKLRIEMSVIKGITKDSIFVTNYFSFYKSNGEPAHEGAFVEDYSFAKKTYHKY
jgi:hypothetical protein